MNGKEKKSKKTKQRSGNLAGCAYRITGRVKAALERGQCDSERRWRPIIWCYSWSVRSSSRDRLPRQSSIAKTKQTNKQVTASSSICHKHRRTKETRGREKATFSGAGRGLKDFNWATTNKAGATRCVPAASDFYAALEGRTITARAETGRRRRVSSRVVEGEMPAVGSNFHAGVGRKRGLGVGTRNSVVKKNPVPFTVPSASEID